MGDWQGCLSSLDLSMNDLSESSPPCILVPRNVTQTYVLLSSLDFSRTHDGQKQVIGKLLYPLSKVRSPNNRLSSLVLSYVLKLFRDFVFHSVDEVGNPVIDLTHVLAHLNKASISVG